MKPHLQCGEQQVSRSNLTKYCACHAGRLTYLVLITYETSFTMRGATGVTIQPHQILRLSRRKTHILSPHHIWNFIYNARSNRYHDPTSPNTAPATKNDTARFQRKSPKTGETSFPMRGRSEHDPSMIRAWSDHENANRNPPRNRGYFSTSPRAFSYCKIQRFAPNLTFKHSPSTAPATKSDAWTSPSTAPATKSDTWTSPSTAPATKSDTWTSPSTAPATKSDTRTSLLYSTWLYSTLLYLTLLDSTHMNPHLLCAEQQVSRSNLTKYCACHAERLTYLIIITYETSFTMRGATGVTIQPHQIPRLPHKMTGMLDRRHIWNIISNARSNRYHDPTSPNTAPATKNDTARFQRKSPKKGETSFPMRGRSEHDPTMIRPWKRKPQPASQVTLLFQLTTSIFYCKIQRFAPNLTFKPSPNTAPATKSDTWTSPSTAPATKSDTWTSPNIAPATKSNTWTSPSTAPATQKDSLT